MNDILWLTMRRMRTPLILMMLMFAASVLGMLSIPGQDELGNPYHLNFLEAAYFVAITTTTIGFGEIPHTFTDAQRLWVFLIIFPNVATWIYSVGAILGLFLDERFRSVLARNRFARQVRWTGDPFYIVCGFGNTGSLVVQGLLQRNLHAVVLEKEAEQVHRMALTDTFARVPALAADVTKRESLEAAGMFNPQCQGVIATTNDDHANLTIAITVKLLRPELRVLARCESGSVSANMASFGTDFIIDPYEIFADRLALALHSPAKYLVQDWLISVPGSTLREPLEPPLGRWLVCGVGRFGAKIVQRLTQNDLEFTVVDSHKNRLKSYSGAVRGRGTEAHTLEQADVQSAVGLIAGTGDDIDNLSIIMTALELNPELFVIARQELRTHNELFDASRADLVARRSLIAARRILAIVTTPLLNAFLEFLVRQDERWAQQLKQRLERILFGLAPDLWVTDLTGETAAGLETCRRYDTPVNLATLTRTTRKEETEDLACLCLLLERGAQRIFLPDDEQLILPGDRLLFAGRGTARREMTITLSDPNRLLGYIAGVSMPRGAIWRWWLNRQRRKGA